MSVRQWLNNNPWVGIGVVAVLLIAAVLIVIDSLDAPSAEEQTGRGYFVNLQTGEIFADWLTRVPPFELEDGAMAVRAHVFSCDDCSPDQLFVGVYEKYPDKAIKEMKEKGLSRPGGDTLVSGDGKTWYHPRTDEATQLWVRAKARCDEQGQTATRCYADR